VDNGVGWKEAADVPIYARRFSSLAVIDAIDMAEEFLKQLDIDSKL
jgi:hypothetical protein